MARDVAINIIGRDRASGAFTSAARSAEAAAGRMSKFSTALGGAIATAGKLGVAIGGFELLSKAIDIGKEASAFQRSMLLIQTQAGASAKEVRAMSKAVLGLSGSVGTAPDKLATSLYHVESVGLRGAKALNVVRIAAEGAKVGNADLEETTNALTATVASNIDGVQNMSQAMGALNAIVGAGDMKLSDLNDALGTGLLTAAKTFGVSITEVGAALATFGDNNIRGADAATKIRMAMQDLSKPAAHADDVLSKIGESSVQLRKDLEQGGLTGAMDDLRKHMEAAGVTGNKVGGFLEDAFTKKAGVGLAILINQSQRYHNKLDEIAGGANTFGSRWRATTQTLAFQWDRLSATFDAAGITLIQRLMPAITQVVHWMGSSLPHALSVAWQAVKPLAQTVGGALVTAWHAFLFVLRPAARMLAEVGQWAGRNAGLIKALGVAVLVTWAAFKGAALIVTLIKAIGTAMTLTAVRALELRDALVAVAVGAKAVSWGALAGGVAAFGAAVYEGGKHLSDWIEKGSTAARVLDDQKNVLNTYTAALTRSNGRLTDSVRSSVALQIANNGLADKFAAVGVDAQRLVQVITGGKSAWAAFSAEMAHTGGVSSDQMAALRLLNAAFGQTHDKILAAAQAHQRAQAMLNHERDSTNQTADAVRKATAGYRANAAEVGHTSHAIGQQTSALRQDVNATQAAALATKDFDTALTLLGAHLSNVGAELAFRQSLVSLRQTLKQNKDALGEHTAAGLADRQAFLDSANAIASHADAMRKDGQGIPAVNRMIADSVNQLKQTGAAAGLSKTQVHNLLAEMGLTPHDIRTKFSADATEVTNVDNHLQQLASQGIDISVRYHPYGQPAAGGGRHFYATGGNVPATGAVSGSGGPTSDTVPAMLSPGEHVWTAGEVAKAGGQGAMYRARRAAAAGLLRFAKGGSVMSFIRGAGFKGDAADTMYGIVGAESGFNATAHNTKPPDNSYGLAQINMYGDLGPQRRRQYHLRSNRDLFNPATNLRVAYALSGHGHNFHPWSTYNSGAYQQYMSGSEGAHVRHGGGAKPGHGGGGGSSASQRRATAVGGASSAISAVNGVPGASRFSVSTFNERTFQAQVKHAKAAIDVAKAAGASAETLKKLRDRLHDIEQAGKRTEKALLRNIDKRTGTLIGTVNGSAQNFMSTFRAYISEMKRAGVAAGTVKALENAETRLSKIRAQNAKVTSQLANARQASSQLASSVRSSVTGSFDITTAGQTYQDQPATAGSIAASAKDAVNKARQFVAVLKKLRKEGLGPDLLGQLAAAGPSALPQAQALAAATPKQIASITGAYASLHKFANQAGHVASDYEYGGLIGGLEKKQKHLRVEFAKDIAEALSHHPSRTIFNINGVTDPEAIAKAVERRLRARKA